MFETGAEHCWVGRSKSDVVSFLVPLNTSMMWLDDNLNVMLYGTRMQASGYRQLQYLVRIKNRTITTRDPRLQVGRRLVTSNRGRGC